MEIATKADIRLVGRAMREDWKTTPKRKAEVMEALLDIVRTKDPELTLEVAKVLIKADEANLKRHELELKKQAADDARRLQLLGILKSLPVGEIAKIAPAGSGGN